MKSENMFLPRNLNEDYFGEVYFFRQIIKTMRLDSRSCGLFTHLVNEVNEKIFDEITRVHALLQLIAIHGSALYLNDYPLAHDCDFHFPQSG